VVDTDVDVSSRTVSYVYYTGYESSQANGVQIIHTTNALQDLGYDIDLITGGDISAYAADNQLEVRSRTHRCPIAVGRETPDRVSYYSYALLRSRRADIIFTRDISFLKFLSVLPWRPSTPIFYEAHQSYSGIEAISKDEERQRLRNADIVISHSTGIAADLESLGLSVHSVIPNAANEDFLPAEYPSELATQLGITEHTRTIVYSGSLHKWKNDIELLIEAAATMQHPDVKVVIVGGERQRIQQLRAFSKQVGVDTDRIEFVGRVPHRRVFDYLSVADIGVVPLKADHPSATKYTSPLKLFEYLLCDLQIVASSVPATASITEPNIHRYEPGDTDDMRRALEEAAAADATAEAAYTYRRRAERIHEIFQSEFQASSSR